MTYPPRHPIIVSKVTITHAAVIMDIISVGGTAATRSMTFGVKDGDVPKVPELHPTAAVTSGDEIRRL